MEFWKDPINTIFASLLKSFTDAPCPKLHAIGANGGAVVIEKPLEVLRFGDARLLGTGFAVDFHVEREPGGEAVAVIPWNEHLRLLGGRHEGNFTHLLSLLRLRGLSGWSE